MCMPYEEEDTCHEHFSVGAHMRRRIHVCAI